MMSQQRKLVDNLALASSKQEKTTLKTTSGQPSSKNTATRVSKPPVQILTISKEEIRQIVHDTITNHPKIQSIEEKLTRLLCIVEQQLPQNAEHTETPIISNITGKTSQITQKKDRDSQELKIDAMDYMKYRELKMTYLPIRNPGMMARLEDVMFNDPNEQLKIVNLFRHWSGRSTSCPNLNKIFKKVFHDDYLIDCNMRGTQHFQALQYNALIQILSDIWIENGSTREEFIRKARLCIRNSHNRVYRRKSMNHPKPATKTSVDNKTVFIEMKIENVDVVDDEFQEEYLESEEIDE